MVVDKLSQIAGAVGIIFWIFLVLLAVNIYLFVTRKDKKIKVVVSAATLILLFIISFQVNDKFLISKSVSSFGITSMIYPEEQWTEFLSQFGYRYDGSLLKDQRLAAFANKTVVGSIETDRAWIKQVALEDAIQNGNYRIFALYMDNEIEGAEFTPTFLAHLHYYPENPIYFNLKIQEHNISKTDNLLLYSDKEDVTKSLALIFAFRGYNVSYALPADN